MRSSWPDKIVKFLIFGFGCLLFFSMLCAPRTYSDYKAPIVFVLVSAIAIKTIWSKRIRIHPHVLMWFGIFFMYGMFWTLIGSYKGNPGINDYLRLSGLWVVLYGIFVSGLSSKRSLIVFVKIIMFSGFIISIYNIAFILKTIGVIPENFITNLDMGANIGIHSGYIQLTAHNIGTLAFVAPFIFSLLVFSDEKEILGLRRRTVIIILGLSIATVLLSGRRILLINILLTPAICYILCLNLKSGNEVVKKKLLYSTVTVLMMGLAMFAYFTFYTDWSISDFSKRFTGAFEEEARIEQINALYDGFTEMPILGSGFGRGVIDVVRSEERPWLYEMTYNLMLYNTGIIGILVYFGCLYWIYRTGLQIVNKHPKEKMILLPLLVGMSSFLIANITNPYFGSYDFMWILFFPVAYINSIKLESGTLGSI